MGQKARGGMWCANCNRPVMGVKNTHRVRNLLSIATIPATSGLSATGLKSERYICPSCGGPAVVGNRNTGTISGRSLLTSTSLESARLMVQSTLTVERVVTTHGGPESVRAIHTLVEAATAFEQAARSGDLRRLSDAANRFSEAARAYEHACSVDGLPSWIEPARKLAESQELNAKVLLDSANKALGGPAVVGNRNPPPTASPQQSSPPAERLRSNVVEMGDDIVKLAVDMERRDRAPEREQKVRAITDAALALQRVARSGQPTQWVEATQALLEAAWDYEKAVQTLQIRIPALDEWNRKVISRFEEVADLIQQLAARG